MQYLPSRSALLDLVTDRLGGRLVTSAALILFLAFVAMATSPGTIGKITATGLGAGILLDATIIRALLVPAAVSLFGRRNWQLPGPAATILRVSPRSGHAGHKERLAGTPPSVRRRLATLRRGA